MGNGKIEVFCGSGKGKTTLALGNAISTAVTGASVIIIQYLKGKEHHELDFLEKIEGMDIRIFRFEKLDCYYAELNPEEKEEENRNIINGVNYARKVIMAQECDFLVLDEVLGLLDLGIISEETILELLKHKGADMEIVLTGRTFPDFLRDYVDSVTILATEEMRRE